MIAANHRVQRPDKQPLPNTVEWAAGTLRQAPGAVSRSHLATDPAPGRAAPNSRRAHSWFTPPSDLPPKRFGLDRVWVLAGISALVVLGWLGAVFLIEPVRFVIFNPRGKTGFEMFLALGQLFGALVIALSASDNERARMRWAATSLLVLGTGALSFGYVFPLFHFTLDPNLSMYGSLEVRTMAGALLVIGLVPDRVPALTRVRLLAILGAGFLAAVSIIGFGQHLPSLVHARDMESLLATTALRSFPNLTGWHLVFGALPLAAGIAAGWGALRHHQSRGSGDWLVVAVVLFAGAQLHSLFWPSMYSSVLTTTSVLRFILTAVVITGGIVELRVLSQQRAALLAQEQERVRQLEQLGTMKRDFSSMVAHELSSPLAAIGLMAEMISRGSLPTADQQRLADRIQGEAKILQLLVRDIRASAEIEQDDFAVQPRPVPLHDLFQDAEAYGVNVLRGRRFEVKPYPDACVMADPERIGQVIRNLLNNAARHTPEGSRIVFRAMPEDECVRIVVEDDGPGIHPDDHERILQKFGRGQNAGEGRGLGLFLSRRILEAHEADLEIDSAPGEGARFSFCLKEAS